MATIKSYTDTEQSKRLAEILPLESANMFFICIGDDIIIRINDNIKDYNHWNTHPCWSLAALLSVLPNTKLCHYNDNYFCQYMGRGDEFPTYSTNEYNNPVDACVAMVEKLHELKKL